MSELEPCPKCSGCVEYTSSRDRGILSSYIRCDNCDLMFFLVETTAFQRLPNLDYETTLMKYNAWCKTSPTSYCDEEMGRCNK